MRRPTFKAWLLVHKWSSLVCTAFLLLLCVTGLPLIFGEEIAHLAGNDAQVVSVPAGTAQANADLLVRRALTKYPDDVPLFYGWESNDTVYVNTGARPDTPPPQMHTVVFNQYTGKAQPVPQFNEGVMYFILRLHSELFAGLPGSLLLGVMALLFAAAIVSGVVLYAPFMRRTPFGTLRNGQKNKRVRWLDLHNLLGIVTLAWALVVALTGAINTLAVPLQQAWQSQQLAGITDKYRNAPMPTNLASLEQAIATARTAEPDMTPGYVSFPGTGYSGEHHYGVFMHGNTPLTERIYHPVLIDAATGELTAKPALPTIMKVLLLSQPLHFGDYGGLPLKILWALLDLIAIMVLVSGLFLWVKRGSTKARVAEFERRRKIASARDAS